MQGQQARPHPPCMHVSEDRGSCAGGGRDSVRCSRHRVSVKTSQVLAIFLLLPFRGRPEAGKEPQSREEAVEVRTPPEGVEGHLGVELNDVRGLPERRQPAGRHPHAQPDVQRVPGLYAGRRRQPGTRRGPTPSELHVSWHLTQRRVTGVPPVQKEGFMFDALQLHQAWTVRSKSSSF